MSHSLSRVLGPAFSVSRSSVWLAAPAAAQAPSAGVMGDLLKDVQEAKGKIVGLAKAMPDAAWDWRPGPGVRSTKEVFVHLTGDNYFIPVGAGATAPAATGIGEDYKTVEAFEKRTADARAGARRARQVVRLPRAADDRHDRRQAGDAVEVAEDVDPPAVDRRRRRTCTSTSAS